MPDPIKFPARHPGTQRAEFRAAANNELQQSQLAADHVAAALSYQHTLRAVRENSLAEGRHQAQGVVLKQGFFGGFVAGALCTMIVGSMLAGGVAQWAFGLLKS